jgi:hypothetical protein
MRYMGTWRSLIRKYLVVCMLFFAVSSLAQKLAATKQALDRLTLTGNISGVQNHTYIEVPFRVSPGTTRITLTFEYTGQSEHTALDLGLEDPLRLRCWSGGNKHLLTVGIVDATPSCNPGLIPAGKWNVLIGVPNIRPKVTSHYTISIQFSRNGAVMNEPADLVKPLRVGAAWYRGDLHMHTAHSDGTCPSQAGKSVPCPVYFTADAAARRGLDFIAITDHNATSQYDSMRELQPYFDKLLLIPGREITTFYGHLNLLGTTQYVDFRLGSKAVPNVNTLLRAMDATGAVTSINHPRDDTGERCMGCGWSPPEPADMHLLAALEAVNGGDADGPHSGIPFWDEQLNRGFRLTGIGGSDSHRPMTPLNEVGSVGIPTTVIYAPELSTPAILNGIRAGHVFLDICGTENRLLEMTADQGGKLAHMGDELTVPIGGNVSLHVHVSGAATGKISLIEDGKVLPKIKNASVVGKNYVMNAFWISDGRRHWIRPEVKGPDGDLWLLGNPVYINWGQR